MNRFFIFGFFISVLLQSFFARALTAKQLTNPKELRYFHCVPVEAKATDKVVHYVFDLRKNSTRLFVTSGLLTLKARELTGLSLVDSRVSADGSVGDIQADVIWNTAAYNGMSFQLDIQDNGGQTMAGKVVLAHETVAIYCGDVNLE